MINNDSQKLNTNVVIDPNAKPAKASHAGLIIILIVVILVILLPIIGFVLIFNFVVKPLMENQIEYIDSNTSGTAIETTAHLTIQGIYDMVEQGKPIYISQCRIFESYVENLSSRYFDLCADNYMNLAFQNNGGRIVMYAKDDVRGIRLEMDNRFEKYYHFQVYGDASKMDIDFDEHKILIPQMNITPENEFPDYDELTPEEAEEFTEEVFNNI